MPFNFDFNQNMNQQMTPWGGFDLNPNVGQGGMQFAQPTSLIPGTGADTNPNWSFGDRMFGGADAHGNKIGGFAMPALQLGTGLLQGYLGMKQYGLAKDQFKDGKKQFAANYENQRRLTNAQLRDRQEGRVASSSGAQSVDSYMNQNGIREY